MMTSNTVESRGNGAVSGGPGAPSAAEGGVMAATDFSAMLARSHAAVIGVMDGASAGCAGEPGPAAAPPSEDKKEKQRSSDAASPREPERRVDAPATAGEQLAHAADVDLAEMAAQELRTPGENGAAVLGVNGAGEQVATDAGRRGERGRGDVERGATAGGGAGGERTPLASGESLVASGGGPVSGACVGRAGLAAGALDGRGTAEGGVASGVGPGLKVGGVSAMPTAEGGAGGGGRTAIVSASATGNAAKAGGATSSGTTAAGTNSVGATARGLAAREALAKLGARTPFSLRSAAGQPADKALGAQIARGLAAALRQGQGTVTLRLAPESLGDLRIQLQRRDGEVVGLIEPSTPVAHRLLSDSLDTLRGSLEAAGVSVGRLEIAPPGEPARSDAHDAHGHGGQTGAESPGERRDGAEQRQHDGGRSTHGGAAESGTEAGAWTDDESAGPTWTERLGGVPSVVVEHGARDGGVVRLGVDATV